MAGRPQARRAQASAPECVLPRAERCGRVAAEATGTVATGEAGRRTGLAVAEPCGNRVGVPALVLITAYDVDFGRPHNLCGSLSCRRACPNPTARRHPDQGHDHAPRAVRRRSVRDLTRPAAVGRLTAPRVVASPAPSHFRLSSPPGGAGPRGHETGARPAGGRHRGAKGSPGGACCDHTVVTSFSVVLHPAVPDPRIHETGYRVGAWRWPRGRFLYGAKSPFLSWTRSPASTPYCETGDVPVSAPCRFRTGGLHASAFAIRR